MPDQPPDRYPHLVVTHTSTSQAFTAPSSGGGRSAIPDLDRSRHGRALQAQLLALRSVAQQAVDTQIEQGLQSGFGLQVLFVGQPDVPLAFESLGYEVGKDARKKIEVLSVRTDGNTTCANVFVPEGRLTRFEMYVEDYLAERKNANGQAWDHRALLNTIAEIRHAELRALWTDDPAAYPEHPDEALWWEVWLPVRDDRLAVLADFRKLAALAHCQVSEHHISFPERTVVLMFGSERQFSTSVLTLNCVAELRRAKETAHFFESMPPAEQHEWAAETASRLTVAADDDCIPRVCLLDSGVNRTHTLVSPFIDPADLHTVNPGWGVEDTANHGTGLAGLVALGDLSAALAADGPLEVQHRLESVKLTPEQGANAGDSRQHSYLFAEAVSRPEVAAPNRPRVFTSAVTSDDERDRGRPSAWSSTVDRLACDYEGDGQFPRLFVLCAGNTQDAESWNTYPASLSSRGIRDPGQAWNALTVGAYTEKINITEPDAQRLTPVAPSGGLSPFTRTSSGWHSAWPLKPDVVFEGGNAGKDVLGAIGVNSLNLLTVHNQPTQRLFTTTNATSAASALGARMAAQLMAAYPALRPETIRALIVHAAQWSDAMKAAYLPRHGPATKSDFVNLIRHCGWGVPSLERALWSAGNSLVLIAEDVLRPFQRVPGKGIVSRDMNLHAMPWPKEQLLALPPDTEVELWVTLSYFIEPNPSARGTSSKFHYPSHRLRFDVQRPLDASTDDFVARINAAAEREHDGDPSDPRDTNWLLGDRLRHRGSLHQDRWHGTAAELANRGFVAVYPSKGWWRTRPAQERYDRPAHYSLIVSIRAPQIDVDLYTPVQQQVAADSRTPVLVET